jgi:hypothetical protein
MTTPDVQACAFAEHHEALKAGLIKYAFQVARLQRETEAKVYDLRVSRAAYVSIAIPCGLAAMVAAAIGEGVVGLLLLLAAFIGRRGWMLASRAIYGAGRVVVLYDLPPVCCPHMQEGVEDFLIGMGGAVERCLPWAPDVLTTKTKRSGSS